MALFGPLIFALWTHGKIAFDPVLCLLLGIGFLIGAYSDALISVLLGINRISAVAIAHLCATIAAVLLALLAVPAFGVVGMAAVLIIPEVAATGAAILVFCELVSLPPRAFTAKSIHWPVGLVRREMDRAMQFLARR